MEVQKKEYWCVDRFPVAALIRQEPVLLLKHMLVAFWLVVVVVGYC